MTRGGWPEDETSVPAAIGTTVYGAVRSFVRAGGSTGEEPVARVVFTDPTGDARAIDLPPRIALTLTRQLAEFSEQIHEGER